MKILFMGNPDFSAVVLEKLNSVYPVGLVVTSLDKPSGRGGEMKAPILKVKAQELGLPVLQFAKVSREGLESIKNFAPDIIVTAAFGQILSDEFLSIAPVLNVHASLLPKYRGSSPIQHAILAGDKETGITIMRTVHDVDAGDVLLKKSTPIGEKETAGELFDRLAILGGEAIVEGIALVESGKAVFTPQDESKVSHTSMITKKDGLIDFSKSPDEIERFVRAMSPWPSAYTYLDGKMLKILDVLCDYDLPCGKCGQVMVASDKNGFYVSANGGCVRLVTVALEGKRAMCAEDFLRGKPIEVGKVLGE